MVVPERVQVQSLYEEFRRTLMALQTTSNPRALKVLTDDLIDLHQQATQMMSRLGPFHELTVITGKTADQWLLWTRTKNTPSRNYF